MPENSNQSKLSNYSINFDGENSFIDCGSASYLNGLSQFSVSCWFNLNTAASNKTIASDWFYNSGVKGHFALQSTSAADSDYGLLFLVKKSNDVGQNYVTTGRILTQNTWNHAVFAYNSGTVTCYINGSPISLNTIGTLPTTLTSQDGNLNIGKFGGSLARLWNGKISQLCIFNYELAENQAIYLYNLNNPMAITGAKPIAYYPLGDNSNPTALAGYPNASVGGSVFNFDGNDDYIDFGNINSFDRTNAFSGSCWVNLTSIDNTQMFISKMKHSTIIGYQFYITTSNKLVFYIGDYYNNNYLLAITDNTFIANAWYNMVFTYDGSSNRSGINIYVNNVLQDITFLGQTTITGSILDSSAPFQISGRDGQNFILNGKISNAAIFNTELTSTQVTTLYNNGAPNDISSLSPTAWYKLDSSEIFNSTSTEWSVDNNAYPSVYKSSLNFDTASSDYIDCGNSLTNGFSQLTISIWANFASVPTNRVLGLASKDNTNQRSFDLRYIQNTGVNFLVSTDGVNIAATPYYPKASINVGEWIHFVGVYDGSNVLLYVNGAPIGSPIALTGSLQNTTSEFFIGKRGFGTTNTGFDGQLSNVAVFNTGLSQSQVTTLYNNGTPEASISHSPVSWYKLDNTTTGVQDSAGSNNGTNNGTTEYAGFVNGLAGESSSMDSSNLVQSDLYRTTPYSNYSVKFDNPSEDYFDFNNNSASIMSDINSLSISTWFKLDSNITSTVVSNWYGGSVTQYLLRYNTSGGIQWYIRANSNTYRIDTEYYPTVGDWVHLVGVKDSVTNGGQIRVYINGNLSTNSPQDNTSFSVAIADINRSDVIGVFTDSSGNKKDPIDGFISNVAYWKETALTSTEVTEIYNSGVPTDLSSFSGTAPDHWCPLDGKKVYYNGTVIVARDAIGTLQATGVNLVQENIEGNAPGSNANGTGVSLDITDLKGDMSNSTKNSHSINMADYGDPNGQGVTPADSGRTTSVPG